MQFLLVLLGYFAFVFILIAVHETGHYLAGVVAGIPASDMRIRLLTFPQHVAIRGDGRWVSPVSDIVRYVELTGRHLASRGAAFLWVAGGMLFETIVVVLVCATALWLGWRSAAFWAAALSLGMYIANVFLMDVPWAIRRRQPMGDTSGLWSIAKLPTILVTVVMVGVRVLLVRLSS